MTKRIAILMTTFLLAGAAQAQDKTDRELQVRYKGVTEIDFATLDVQGTMVKPEIKYISNLTGAEFGSLIKPRIDFKPEMNHSIDEIK